MGSSPIPATFSYTKRDAMLKNLFPSKSGKLTPPADTINLAGGVAYSFTDKHALAQYASTGCLGTTYYASAEEQLDVVLKLCEKVDTAFIAKCAIHARQRGYMKDIPALLCAVLAQRDVKLLEKIFPRVINNGKMLRNFSRIVRSGVVGRKSFGHAVKRMMRGWFTSRTPERIFTDSVGADPSLADVIKMVRPVPRTDEERALYGYLIGADPVQKDRIGYKVDKLPLIVQQFEAWKKGEGSGELPKLPFELLTGLPLTEKDWVEIAKNAGWHMTRMNLNTFLRHGVFSSKEMVRLISDRLRDKGLISKANVFPYQLLAAYMNANGELPPEIREALQDAMEFAVDNVPSFDGNIFIFPDVSGSMHSPVTGHRGGGTTKVRCIDVAALVAASVLRKNKLATVIPFEGRVVNVTLNPRDSVMTNAQKLSEIGGGSTNCSSVLQKLVNEHAKVDLAIYVSDNESWVDSNSNRYYNSGTETMRLWGEIKRRNPNAKLVCIDLTPNRTTQAQERNDILNIGGFSDSVFDVIADFAADRLGSDHWVGVIEATEI
jgi:60 kDa SS-A/Ro ribonucleoprotein